MLNANLEFRVVKKFNSGEVGDLLTIHSINRDLVFGRIYGKKLAWVASHFNWMIQQGIIKLEDVAVPLLKEKPLPLLAAVL